MSAESVGDSTTPGVRVTWNTILPPECVAAMRVEFRTTRRYVVASNTTTNTSQTVVIQTGLRCGTYYYIRVLVTGKLPGMPITPSYGPDVQVLVGGNETVCM